MRSFLLSLLLAGSLSAAPPILKVADVRNVTVVGSQVVLFMPSSVYTSEVADVVYSGDTLTLSGSYTATSPHSITTTYTCTLGLDHAVTTDCAKLSKEACAEEHRKALAAMLKEFPRGKY